MQQIVLNTFRQIVGRAVLGHFGFSLEVKLNVLKNCKLKTASREPQTARLFYIAS